jgi:uncharacterized caspase-like protein
MQLTIPMTRAALTALTLTAAFVLSALTWPFAPTSAKQDKQTKSQQNVANASPNQEKCVALVIGINQYAKNAALQPLNDAHAVTAELRALGFDVLTGENPSQGELRQLLHTFGERARNGSVSLFYFAGVGAQANGVNYLIPASAKIKRQADVKREAIALDDVLAQMKEAGARANLVLLDACRVHPLPAVRRLLTPGLAEVKAPSNTLISYATQPGQIERTQPGRRNSFYTTNLLQHLRTPGLTLRALFQRMHAGVEELTLRKQSPWMTSTIAGDFYFVPVKQTPADKTVAPADDISTWTVVASSTDPQDFKAFLTKFPNSVYAEMAQVKLRQLIDKPEPVTEPQQSLPAEPSTPPSPPTQTTEPAPQHEVNLVKTSLPALSNDHLALAARAELERAFYAACYEQKNVALCCQLSRELVTKFSSSGYTPAAANKVRQCEINASWEQFKEALREYYSGPNPSRLEKLFATGEAVLRVQPDYPYVVAQIMIAGTGAVLSELHYDRVKVYSAVLAEIYRARERVKVYVERALKLFESNAKPSDEEQLKQLNQFRADVLALGYQYLGYYYSLSNAAGAREQALAYLNKAVQIKDKPALGLRDPLNYYLRANIRNAEYLKLSNEYKALSDEEKVAEAGAALLQKINAVVDLLIADYARIVALADNPANKALRDFARESLTSLWKYRHNGSLAGMEEAIKRYAADPSAP